MTARVDVSLPIPGSAIALATTNAPGAVSAADKVLVNLIAARQADLFGSISSPQRPANLGNFSAMGNGLAGLVLVGVTVTPNGDEYASVLSGDIYKKAFGSTAFAAMSQTHRVYTGMASDRLGNVYVGVYGGLIYECPAGASSFTGISGTTGNWYGLKCDPKTDDLWACSSTVDIYKMLARDLDTGTATPIAQTAGALAWWDLAFAPNGDKWATVMAGDLYLCRSGDTVFRATGQTARAYTGVVVTKSGDVIVGGQDIPLYVIRAGQTSQTLQSLGQSAGWYQLAEAPDGSIRGVEGADLYTSPAAPARTIFASDFSDSVDSRVLTINGLPYVRANPGASLRIGTPVGCSVLGVKYCNTAGQYRSLAYSIDGGSQTVVTDAGNTSEQILQISLTSTSAHVVTIQTSPYQDSGGNGTFVREVFGLGGAPVVLPPLIATKAVAAYGDSILATAYATNPYTQAWIQIVRAGFSGRVAVEAWSGRALNDEINGYSTAANGSISALAYRLCSLTFGAAEALIWDAIGVNDATQGKLTDVQFGTQIAALYDAIHAILPTAKIVCQTPIISGSESSTNSLGLTLAAYRAAKAGAASGRSWVTVVDGTTLLVAGNLQDGIHPNTAGHATYGAAALAEINSLLP